MATLFRILARLPRFPLALAASMLVIALAVEGRDPLPVQWLPKLPLVALLAWSTIRPPKSRPDLEDPAAGSSSRGTDPR